MGLPQLPLGGPASGWPREARDGAGRACQLLPHSLGTRQARGSLLFPPHPGRGHVRRSPRPRTSPLTSRHDLWPGPSPLPPPAKRTHFHPHRDRPDTCPLGPDASPTPRPCDRSRGPRADLPLPSLPAVGPGACSSSFKLILWLTPRRVREDGGLGVHGGHAGHRRLARPSAAWNRTLRAGSCLRGPGPLPRGSSRGWCRFPASGAGEPPSGRAPENSPAASALRGRRRNCQDGRPAPQHGLHAGAETHLPGPGPGRVPSREGPSCRRPTKSAARRPRCCPGGAPTSP